MANRSIRCPKCDQPLTQVGQFRICPQHGQVSLEQPFVPLRIFLSYGHDGNEELVRRIQTDLERRGHDVWIDKSEIKFGDDWRRSITEGIVDSHGALSFLSETPPVGRRRRVEKAFPEPQPGRIPSVASSDERMRRPA